MRAGLIAVMIVTLLLASCGDDDGGLTSSTAGPATSTGVPTTGGQVSTTTGDVTTTAGTGGESGWMRVPPDDDVFGNLDPSWMSAAMHGVSAGGPGLIAVGYRYPSVDYGNRPAVWTTSDGAAWTVVPHDEADFGYGGDGYLEAVAAGPPGMVAVGRAYNGDDYDALVYAWPDGSTWSRLPDGGRVLSGPGWQGMHAVVAGGPGFVAVGYAEVGEGDEADRAAAVWTSSDGVTWTRVPHDEALFGGENDQEMFGVVAAGPGLVAVGSDDDVPAAWVSADGWSWQKVGADRFSSDPSLAGSNKTPQAVVAHPRGLVAVGYLDWFEEDADAPDDWDGAVWVSGDGAVWTLVSEDAATFGGSGRQVMQAVTPGGPGLVAVGWEGTGDDADAVVWTSADGSNWARVRDAAVFGGAGDQEMLGVAVVGSRVVAVGRDGVNAAVWVSPAGG